jgi:hypothetical protein
LPPCCHPGGVMNGLPESPTTQDPTLQALVERGLRAARERAQADVTPEPAAPPVVAKEAGVERAPRGVRLASNRACVESNFARKGLWRPEGRLANATRLVYLRCEVLNA